MTKEKIFLVIAIIIVMAALVILIIVLNDLKEEMEEMEKEIEEKPLLTLPKRPAIAEEIYGLSGEIKEIKDRTLLVEAKIFLADSTKKPLRQTVKIVTTDETRILKLKFPEEIPRGSTEPIFPEKTEIGFDDLKIGDKIDIEIPDNIYEKIINELEIVASTSTSIISVIE